MKRPIFFPALLLVTASAFLFRQPRSTPADTALESLQKANTTLQRDVLDNGLVCLIKQDRSAPVVALQVWVKVGSIYEGKYLGAGLSHAIEHMIFKGTEKRGPGQITKEINDVGGSINAYTSFDRTVFHTELPSAHWEVGLDVLYDALTNCAFDQNEWDKERQVIMREIAMGNDDPQRVLGKLLWRTAYQVHPYRFPVIGYKDILENIQREDLRAFFRHQYIPENMIVVVVGDVDPAKAKKKITDTFGTLERKSEAPAPLPKEPPQITGRIARETGAYNVSRIEMAFHTVAFSHPDAPALDLLAQIAGEGKSSRLVQTIEEKQQLVHSVDAWSYTPVEPGLWGISATFAPDKEDEVIQAIEGEIESWLAEGFSRSEIEKARRLLLVSELKQLQTMDGQAGNYGAGEFYAHDPLYMETYLSRLARISPAQLRGVAEKYLKTDRETIAILSPAQPERAASAPQEETFAEPTRLFLSNNVRLLVREDRRFPLVFICAAIGGGVVTEEEKEAGITRLLSETMIRGAGRRSQEDIADEIESLGGDLTAFSGYDSYGLKAQCFSGDVDHFLSIVSDCLLHPRFPGEEVGKEKERQVALIAQQRERPFFIAQEALRAMLFPEGPYGWAPEGKSDSVKTLTRADLLARWQRTLTSSNIVLSVFGDISKENAQRFAERYFSAIPIGPASFVPPEARRNAAPILPARAKREEARDQAIVLLGFPGLDRKDPRRDALSVLESAMSGLSSDLGTAVREDRGLAYYVGAYQQTGVCPGMYVVYAGTRKEQVAEVQFLMEKEISRVTSEGLRDEEFQRAQEQLVSEFYMGLQNNAALAMTCAIHELVGPGYDYAFSTAERIRALTPENVQDVARSILSTNRLAVSIVIPQDNDQKEPDEAEERND